MTVNNLNINYIDSGIGETVLLLHGWGANIDIYAPIINLLKEHMRIVAMDLPGFGKSDEPDQSWNVDDFADFVSDFCKVNNLHPTVLIGHSHGGRIIIKMLAGNKCSFDVKKVILIDSAGILPKRSMNYYFKVYSYKFLKKVSQIKLIKSLFPNLIEDGKKKHGSQDYRNASDIMRQTLVRVVNEDLTGLLPELKPETLLIWGENDKDTPLTDGQKMEKLIPNAGLVVLKNAGHYSFLDKWGQFSRVLASFLNFKLD